MSYQVFQGLGYLLVGAVFESVAEFFAVDLAVPQERAQSRVEDRTNTFVLSIVVYLVDEPVASDPNAPLIFSPAEPAASWRTRVLAGVSNGYVYAD